MFLDHTQRRSTVGRTPLDERSARRRYLYLTTHDTHNRQISMPPVGFEPTISVGERPAAAWVFNVAFSSNKGHLAIIFIYIAVNKILWDTGQTLDVRGSVHHRIIHTEITNKMQQCIGIYYSTLIWSSTCFRQHTAHHQEPKNCTSSLWFYIRMRLMDVEFAGRYKELKYNLLQNFWFSPG
jgi:hypothetical protein